MKYVFKDSPITIKGSYKADAQKIGEALERIASVSGGSLTPTSVVEAAKNQRNPLHKHFEWDDSIAAQSWRIEQARSIIQCIHAMDDDAESGRARAFISVTTKDGTAYHTLGAIKESVDLQAQVLKQAERDLEAFEKRYKSIQDICAIVKSAREAIIAKRKKSDNRVSA